MGHIFKELFSLFIVVSENLKLKYDFVFSVIYAL